MALEAERLALQKSASFRLGNVVLRSFGGMRSTAALPISLLREIRGIRDERRRPPSRKESPRPRFVKRTNFTMNAGRSTDFVELSVDGGGTLHLSGKLVHRNAGEFYGAVALLSVQALSKTMTPLVIETPQALRWSKKKLMAFGYVLAENDPEETDFSVSFALPAHAKRVRIGVEGWSGNDGTAHITLDPHAQAAQTGEEAYNLVPKLSGYTPNNSPLVHAHLTAEEREKLVKVISITDEFTADCISPDTRNIRIKKPTWEEEFETHRDAWAFFAESAWRGNDESWNYAMTKPEKWGGELAALRDACTDAGIPSVFWNKEDPVNFDTFIDTAKTFDHVFTTDVDCVARYEKFVGQGNAHVMMFAAQSSLHNPIRSGPSQNRVAFTGSWRGIKYPKRAEWLDRLLGPAQEMGVLDIYDRYAQEKENPDLIFPDRFQPALRGGLAYADLVDQVYKSYDAFVNVNSVEGSDTMLARRVFEILGCGAPVVSSYSPATEKIFGDLVAMPETEQEARDCYARLLGDDLYRARQAARGVRHVHSAHTYRHRLEEMAEKIGKPFVAKPARKVSILCSSKRPEFLPAVAEQIRAQTYGETETIFVMHSDQMREEQVAQALAGVKNLTIMRNDEANFLAHALNAAVEIADGDTLAKWDDDDLYGPNYLFDSVQAFDYAPRTALVGKNSYFTYMQGSDKTYLRFPGKDNRLTKLVHGGTMVWDRRKVDDIQFPLRRQGTDTGFIQALLARRLPILSTNAFNFVHMRYADMGKHTWKISDADYLGDKTQFIHDGKPDRSLVYV